MIKKNYYIWIILLLITSCNGKKAMTDKTVVETLDVNKYLGKWYEIARYDHKFERGLVGVTAEYSLKKDGKIKVVNSGYKDDLNGEKSEAIGKAKIPDISNPAKIKVSFFWIFYADYFVLDLDKNYQWAIVGSSSDKYLWILSRTPKISNETYEMLLKKISDRGYDTSKLLLVKQANISE